MHQMQTILGLHSSCHEYECPLCISNAEGLVIKVMRQQFMGNAALQICNVESGFEFDSLSCFR